MTEPSQPAHPPSWRSVRRIAAALAAVLATVLIVFVTNVGGLRSRVAGGQPRIGSIAILPLENLSRDPGQEYFADGQTEALIADVAQLGALRVIARASMMAYKATGKPHPQVARELSADVVVTGSVLRIGDRVRMTVRLVTAPTSRPVWEKSAERDLKDLPLLRSELVQALAEELQVAQSADERTRLARAKPVVPEAQELYLQGRFRMHRGTDQDLQQAIALFEQAIGRDAMDAQAWTSLAESQMARLAGVGPPADVMPKVKAAAERAIGLDGSLAAAHTVLGLVHLQWDWDWAGAEREMKHALDLSPSSGDAHAAYGMLLTVMGRGDEAVAENWLAQQSDPLSVPVNLTAGWSNFQARRFEQALVDFGTAIDIDPRSGPAHAGLAMALAQKGRLAEALREAERAVDADPSPVVLAVVGGVYAADGQATMARRLRTLAVQGVRCSIDVAAIHVGLQDPGEAFRWLERGFQERSACMPFVRTDARLDPLRADRRYANLIDRMGFPK
ncbi:MAG: tetratricopeptide repeat protein [Vicinamibacterales bacterium]